MIFINNMLDKVFLYFLKKIPPELAHKLVIFLLSLGINKKKKLEIPSYLTTSLFGFRLSHPIGLAAGFDKNAEALRGLLKLNFSFIEIGTVTPKAQIGNKKPRVFRYNKEETIINSLGFPNKGALKILSNLKKIRRFHILGNEPIIGVNIGFNKESISPVKDYVICLNIFFKVADYISINISSPNTPGLRKYQDKEKLNKLLSKISSKKKFLEKKYKRFMPLAIKISPDNKKSELESIVSLSKKYSCDAIIATNTSSNESLFSFKNEKHMKGGFSGKKLFNYSNLTLKRLRQITPENIEVIGVGGVNSSSTAKKKLELGANAIQIYSGIIFRGPHLVSAIVKELKYKKSNKV